MSRTLIDVNKRRARWEHVCEEQKNKRRIKSRRAWRVEVRVMALVGIHFSEDFASRFDGCPPGVSWRYDRKEMLVDGIVHFVGLGLALVGAAALFLVTYHSANGIEAASVTVYVVGLLAMLGCSAAYNLWPISPTKWLLRRFDHSAIFLFIAATYTPLITPINPSPKTWFLLFAVWAIAIFGVFLKCLLPGRFDRASIVLCLLLGCSGFLAYDTFAAELETRVLLLVAAGGGLYSIGVIFHLWEKLRFQNAIWHGFVLVAAVCHYVAIFCCVAPGTAGAF